MSILGSPSDSICTCLKFDDNWYMIPKFGTETYAKTRGTTPGGGASALGTAPLPMPGTRGSTRLGIYDSLRLAEKIVS